MDILGEILAAYFKDQDYTLSNSDCNDLTKYVGGLERRITELESLIIEADACFNVDGKPGAIDAALCGLVTMCDMGAKALNRIEELKVTCKWTLIDSEYSYWTSDCNGDWAFTDGDPEENGMKYCPFCGKKLEQVTHLDEMDLDKERMDDEEDFDPEHSDFEEEGQE